MGDTIVELHDSLDCYHISPERIKSAKAFWEPRYGRELSDEETKEIIRNMLHFFIVLLNASSTERSRGDGCRCET